MKKNININLFGAIYAIDEDAYNLLDNYLNNMKSYFDKREGGDEIADDIEHRVAEHLWMLKEQGQGAVDIETVKRIISSIGNPAEVDGSSEEGVSFGKKDSTKDAGAKRPGTSDDKAETSDSSHTADDQHKETGNGKWIDRLLHYVKTHRFYRDGKDKIAGGVISGLRHYCGGGDIVVWRVCAVLLTLATFTLCQMDFTGVLQRFFILLFTLPLIIYVALWLLAPVAKTAEDRLMMAGEEVTPESISRAVIAEVDEANKNTAPNKRSGTIMSSLVEMVKFCAKSAAFMAFAVMTAVALAYLAFGVVYSIVGEPFLLLFNNNQQDVQVLTSIPLLGLYWIISALCWLIVAILPLLGIIRSFKPKRKPLGMVTVLSLVGTWIIAIIAGIIMCVLFAIHVENENRIIDRQQNTRNGIYLDRWTWEKVDAEGWTVAEAKNVRFGSLFAGDDSDPLCLGDAPFRVSPDKNGKPMTLSLSRKQSLAEGEYTLECMSICTAMDATLSVWSGDKCLAMLRLDGYGAADDRMLKDFDWAASRDNPLFREQKDSTTWVDNVSQGNDEWHYLASRPFHHDGGTLEYRLRIGQRDVKDAPPVGRKVWMAHETLRLHK